MTIDQQIASDPNLSVWVAANAGTGKTKVLTDRVLRLLLAGSLPHKILCITYTKAAASEMEHRIEQELGLWATQPDEVVAAKLEALMDEKPDKGLLERAKGLFVLLVDAPQRIRIQTIHGFCQSILKRFPLEANVAPHFTLIDDRIAAELLVTSTHSLFEREDPILQATVQYLSEQVSEYSFNLIISSIIKERSKWLAWFNQPAGLELLLQALQKQTGYSGEESLEVLLASHFAYTQLELDALYGACEWLNEGTPSTDIKTSKGIKQWLESQRTLEQVKAYSQIFLTQKNEPRKKMCTAEVKKQYPDLVDILEKEQQRIYEFIRAFKTLNSVIFTSEVMKLASYLLGIYQHLKNRHCYLDYDDIIIHTVSLLSQQKATAWVLYKLDGGIDHLLVDEAQDTSPAQWQLIDSITEEFFAGQGASDKNRTLFVVGDAKQSIFSFQGARPDAFHAMQLKLRKRIMQSERDFRNVRLNLSFRSTEAVLKAVDNVFANPLASEGLVFEENVITHEAYRKGMGGKVEFWNLVEAEETQELQAWEVAEEAVDSPAAQKMLAQKIADEIQQMLRQKRKLPASDKIIEAGDILILVQKRTGLFVPSLMRALNRHQIPVSGADRLWLNEHIAVQDLVALCKFLLLPQDDMTLATVLKSPFLGITEEALFTLSYNRHPHTLWQRLNSNSDFQKEAEWLGDLLAKVDYMQPYELLAHILETLGGRKKLMDRLGSEIEDPLNEFLSLAITYSNEHTPSLEGFIHWFETTNTVIKRDMEKAGNAVRIMTVHGSKGLQAPIVFLADCDRINTRSDNSIVWFEDDIPFLTASSEEEDHFMNELKAKRKAEKLCEYRRLLYVAMTRAEDELYLCGVRTAREPSPDCWYSLIAASITQEWEIKEDRKILSCPQSIAPKRKMALIHQNPHIEMPEWIGKAARPESNPTRPLTPSHWQEPEANASPVKDNAKLKKGLLVHRLLQYLPEIAPSQRVAVLDNLLKREGADFSAIQQREIKTGVLAILDNPEFALLFSKDAVAEAPICGIIQDAEGNPVTISGQIDRLCVSEKEVYIIDYKTSINVPESLTQVPKPYLKQMEAYRKLVTAIYPEKQVKCGLLWTANASLMML